MKNASSADRCRRRITIPFFLMAVSVFLSGSQSASGQEKQLAETARKSLGNLKVMMWAVHEYHDDTNQLPPAAICNKEGKPLLSWRVLILPYVGEKALFREFKLSEPWDSKHNIKLLPRMPKIYAPVVGKTKEGHTFYQVFVGEGAPFNYVATKGGFPGSKCRYTFGSLPDGTSNVLGVVEAGEPVPWTKPVDLVYDAKKPLPKMGGLFKGLVHVGLLDGSTRVLKPARPGVTPQQALGRGEISEATLRAAIVCDDAEPVGPEW